MKTLAFRGTVTEITSSDIPQISIATIVSEDREITIKLDVHEKLKVFDEGDLVEVVFSSEKPDYVYGRDFVGRGIIFALRKGRNAGFQVSIGGLQVNVLCSEELIERHAIEPMEEIYVKISRSRYN